ncbi:hypothetical protein F5Y16DRAFT_424422 [Xylariaceae sp. FL0255]|nr:hypothetical protein F5Y16DRAFT_424422 [Xylariaceae sp. FL0255]
MDNVPLIEKAYTEDVLVSDKSSSKWDFLILTVPFFSLQLAWSIQQVFGITYLSSLGIADAQIPLFVVSGPVAGIIVPPIFAALSEMSHGRLGKRKPFIFAGGCGTILSFLLLAAAEPVSVTLSYGILGTGSNRATTTTTHLIAGLSIYALNFSIQPLALGLRASVVDHFAPVEQAQANLRISIFSSMGSIFVALVGLGYSPDFRSLSIVVSGFIAIMLAIVAMTKNTSPVDCEDVLRKQTPKTAYHHFIGLLERVRHLPPITKWTCQVQLVSWFAWFFVLNYTSVLASRIYQIPGPAINSAPPDTGKMVAAVALLFHSASLISLIFTSTVWGGNSSVTYPVYYKDEENAEDQVTFKDTGGGREKREAEEEEEEFNTQTERVKLHSGPGDEAASIAGPDLHRQNTLARRVWKFALLCLAASVTAVAVLVTTAPKRSATRTTISILLGANGALFGLSNWVPYSLIAYEASIWARTQFMRKAKREHDSCFRLSESSDDISEFGKERGEGVTDMWEGDGEEDRVDETPALLAVHNMAIMVPQVVAAVVSWLLINALDAMGIQQNVWIYAISVPAAILAACL